MSTVFRTSDDNRLRHALRVIHDLADRFDRLDHGDAARRLRSAAFEIVTAIPDAGSAASASAPATDDPLLSRAPPIREPKP